MSNYIKPTIQFMAFVRHDPGTLVMATEATADTFILYLYGFEWTPNIDRRGCVDPQMGEDLFYEALSAARRMIVLAHDMRKSKNPKDWTKGDGWLVHCPESPFAVQAWGEEPEQALDRLRIKQEKAIAAELNNITTQD